MVASGSTSRRSSGKTLVVASGGAVIAAGDRIITSGRTVVVASGDHSDGQW